ncbi:DEP domain-containing protein 1B isoform X2 [Nematostella vectensis]|nr:DEP domain-containing protein 1B isoform X2 [Nematostella vectensis]
MKASLTVKRRRYRMKTYEDAFLASEAIDWLHGYLQSNPNFGPNVSRQQAVQLCQKFLNNGVIEDVRGKNYNSVFEDNSHPFRFKNIRYSPYKGVKSPVKSLGKENPSNSTLKSCNSSSNLPDFSPPRLRKRPSFSFKPLTRSSAPSRTPLVDKANLPESAMSDSKAVNAPVKRRKLIRRDSSASIIMNPVALGLQPCSRSLTEKEISQVWWSISISRLVTLLDMENTPDEFKRLEYDISCVRENAEEQRMCKASEVVPPWLLSAMKCLVHWPIDEQKESASFPKYPGFERDVFKAIVDHYHGFHAPLIEENILPLFIRTADTIVRCKMTALKSMQYCCLLLQPHMRRNLQVLIKFMVKLAQNTNISLSSTLPTRELVIQSFSKCTFGHTGDMNVIRLLFFMMENFPDVFKKPEGLKFHVDQRILFLQNCRGNKHQLPRQQSGVTYCERVTKEEYKEEGILNSQKALKDLLDQIIDNQTLSEKQRRKQLKQFEKAYPGIYYARFPEITAGGTCTLQRSKQLRNIMKPLTTLKGVR